jgi:hypothetical protein
MSDSNRTVGSPAERENNYADQITKLSPEAHGLLTKYSHIPEEDILPHVHAIVSPSQSSHVHHTSNTPTER